MMNKGAIRVKVAGIISEQVGLRGEDIKDDLPLAELGVDSLDFVEMVMDAEDYFDISITDEEAEKLTTLAEVVECIAKHVNVREKAERGER